MKIEAKSIAFCIVIALKSSFGFSQNNEPDYERFVQNVWGEVEEFLSENEKDLRASVSVIANLWPDHFVAPKMIELLENPDFEIKLKSCETLLLIDSERYRERILATIQEISFDQPQIACRKAIVQLKLQVPNSKEEVRNFASLQNVGVAWKCPLCPNVKGNEGESCTICKMDLVISKADAPSDLSREAQMLALEELAIHKELAIIPVLRELIVSDALSRWRQSAACILARVEPQSARRHVEAFLDAGRFDTLSFVAYNVPEQFVDELRAIADNDKRSIELRVVAAVGLATTGHHEYLDFLRFVAVDSEADLAARAIAIDSIGRLGGCSDIELLFASMSNDIKFFVAPAISRLLKNPKVQDIPEDKRE